ncbi:hypothetical protein FJTKL_00676 [Diaporthe vaccinii]|uniref:Uncharacterized protein n=1 Tax=Diaporthe vaccinii TaxID=105482 RepID=A0ABR4F663_9PEZI
MVLRPIASKGECHRTSGAYDTRLAQSKCSFTSYRILGYIMWHTSARYGVSLLASTSPVVIALANASLLVYRLVSSCPVYNTPSL